MQPVETYFKSLKYKIESGWKVKNILITRPNIIPKEKTYVSGAKPWQETKIKLYGKLIILEKYGGEGHAGRPVSMGQQNLLCVIFKQNIHTNEMIWKWLSYGAVSGDTREYC